MAGQPYSVVEYSAEHERYKCGYCKSPNTNFSHGMWAHALTVYDYQKLIDRGWRRSGSYCYKPMMDQTCCPMYTIKCEAKQFKITKSQKKILKRMNKFLKNDDTMDTCADQHDNLDSSIREIPHYNRNLERTHGNIKQMNVSSVENEINERLQSDSVDSNTKSPDSKMKLPYKESDSVIENHDDKIIKRENTVIHKGPCVSTKVPCKKAKLLRMERKKNKLLAQGKSENEIDSMFNKNKQQNNIKTLEELFEEINNDGVKKLELKLVRTSPVSSEYLATAEESFNVFKKYETSIHGVPEDTVTKQKFTRFLVMSPLQIKLVKIMSDEFLNTLDASANLFKKYQMAIHGERPQECDKHSFCDFLVKSPLQPHKPDDGPPDGYGSFHEQYWLNNELIAVGVIDILPLCISSVYFFYDPVYSQLSLGTFSSLKEVHLTRQFNLEYYYMGFYIHTCPKMKYKARMQPSKLLCPETYMWCDIGLCLQKLDRVKYCRFNEDIDAIDEDGMVDLQKVLILYNNVSMPYRIYKIRFQNHITNEIEDEIKEYASLVGMKCAQSLLLYRS